MNSALIVFKHLKTNLEDLMKKKNMTNIDKIQVGIQMIECAENLHLTGYIHTDIKLDNIMVDGDNQLFLIELGCAEKFEHKDGSHRPNLHDSKRGIVHFASKNAFVGDTLSRRDDIIQIVYNIMCLFN